MTASTSPNFTYTRNQIIKAAARKLGAFAAGETPDPQTIQDFSDALNLMVKHWNATGIHLWTVTEGTLFPQPNQAAYQVGGANAPDVCAPNEPGNQWQATYTLADAAAGATTLTLNSADGISNGYQIGVVLDSGSIQWTTVNGAPVGDVVTLADALTDSSAAGQAVYTFAEKIVRPLRIVSCRRVQLQTTPYIETPMMPPLSRLDYRNLPNKLDPGIPNQFYYDPQLDLGNIFIWPVPINASYAINFTYYRPINNFDTAGNTADLPQEWISCLVFNLAKEMALEYDCPPARAQMIEIMAQQKLDTLMMWDREPESVYFGVDFAQTKQWG